MPGLVRSRQGASLHRCIMEASKGSHKCLLFSNFTYALYTAKVLLGSVIKRALLVYVIRRLREEINRCSDVEDYVDLSYSFHLKLMLPSIIRGMFAIKPTQIKEEIAQLLSILAGVRPKTLLEIGTASGGTLFLFCQVAEPDAIVISVDLPGGPFGGGYPEWRIPLYKSFAKEGQRIHLIRADSHDPKTLEIVKRILGDGKLDFLFIDGDHTYEGVKRDFEIYSPLVRKGGIIAFHDIVPGPPENVGGVPTFWNEIKWSFTYNEIVKDWQQGGYGIGVIYV
ncbi:MAG: class I SAM-dependent methyltransferase [Thermofilaceae archaeon]